MEPGMRFRSGKRVYLRALDEADVPRITRWLNDGETTRYMNSGRFPTNAQQQHAWMSAVIAGASSHHDIMFAVCRTDDDQHIGNTGLHQISLIDRGCVCGLIIGDATSRGQGYGDDAMRVLLRYAFVELNLERVELSVMAPNSAGRRLYERLGFTVEGTLRKKRFREGEYLDEIVMSLLRSEWAAS